MSATEHFRCRFRLDGRDHYVIWYTNAHDGLVEVNGRIASFALLRELEDYAGAQGFMLKASEPDLYDWDLVEQWCQKPSIHDVDPALLLKAWNMLNDARARKDEPALSALAEHRNDAIYDKLFHADMSAGAYRDPGWSKDEVTRLSQVLRLGLAHLRERLADPGL